MVINFTPQTFYDSDAAGHPQTNDPYINAAYFNSRETFIDAIVTQLNGLDFDLTTQLLGWTYASAFRLQSATRDSNEAITTASVVWPDGSTGTFTTDTASTSFPGTIDAYHVTYVPSSGPTKTITQTAVTRDANGAVTAQPAVTIA